jgi:hypothetical protein
LLQSEPAQEIFMNIPTRISRRSIAALIALSITGLTLASMDTLARSNEPRSMASSPSPAHRADFANAPTLMLEPIVVTARRLPATGSTVAPR